jgi:hypothetical protein
MAAMRHAIASLLAVACALGASTSALFAQEPPVPDAIVEKALGLMIDGDAAGLAALLTSEPRLVTTRIRLSRSIPLLALLPIEASVQGRNTAAIVNALLEHGAPVMATDSLGCTPLHYAVERHPRLPQAEMLALARDMDEGAYGCGKLLADLHLPVNPGDELDVVRLLIAKGADVNAATTREAWTPLHGAALVGRQDLIDLLLAHGASASLAAKDSRGLSPADVAEQQGHADVARALRDRPSSARR